MPYDFDKRIDRRGTNCGKWEYFGDGVLPMWVADMDFCSPPPVIEALRQRVEHGVFGYGNYEPREMLEVVIERLATRHHLNVGKETIAFLPGLIVGLNAVCRAIGDAGDEILTLTPAYPPFFDAVKWAGKQLVDVPLATTSDGVLLRYEIDFDALEAAITPRTKLLLFCNPHNPVGRMYSRAELERIADIALRHDLIICSDEIHCDLSFDAEHISTATLSPEVADRTITLLAPSKTFNLAGLSCAFSVTTNPELREKIAAVKNGMVGHPNIFGFVAATAAYRYGQPWLDEVLPYLRENRDTVVDYVATNMPGVKVTRPEGTYLSWLDFNALELPDNKPADFFLKTAKVALNEGAAFGKGGEGFARLNFGCPRSMLLEGLDKLHDALEQVGQR